MPSQFNLAGTVATDLTRRTGSLHLAVSGLINITSALILGALFASGRIAPLLTATLLTLVDEVTLVANARTILLVAAWGTPTATIVLLMIGSVQLYNAWNAYYARHLVCCLGSAVLGLMNPIAFPIGLVAMALLWLSRGQFIDKDVNIV